jgi:branched-chain amino acid transport system permease protein
MNFALHVLTLVLIYIVSAYAVDLLAGRTGLLSVAHAAFYGVGAYTSALLSTRWDWPFLASLGAAVGVGAVVSLAVSLPSARLWGDHFVIATFGFQMIALGVIENWMGLTRGPLGIPGIPHPTILGWEANTKGEFVLVAGTLAALASIVVGLIAASPLGRVLHAIREDEVFAEACGKSTVRVKLTAFAMSSSLSAMAGALYAHYITYIDSTSFTIMESILVLSMVIIGGAGSFRGPLIGAIVLATLPEVLRFVGLPTAAAANLRQIIYGTLLVVMMVARPRGLVGRYAFSR